MGHPIFCGWLRRTTATATAKATAATAATEKVMAKATATAKAKYKDLSTALRFGRDDVCGWVDKVVVRLDKEARSLLG